MKLHLHRINMLDHARTLSGRVLLHIFASHKRYGGGWKNHSNAQEEFLFNQLPALRYGVPPPDAYPIDGVEGREGFVVEGTPAFVFVPAPVAGKATTWTLQERAARLVQLAEGYDHLVTGAWGCGVFGNDPTEVAKALQKALGSYAGTVHLCFTNDKMMDTFRRVLSEKSP